MQAYGKDSLLVEEAAFSATAGNSEELYAVKNADSAPDVSDVANLSQAPASDVVSKKLVANLVQCPTLGAPSRETQANPLLDNYEGMTIVGGPGPAAVSLISDDNFSAAQFTRVLNLLVSSPSTVRHPGFDVRITRHFRVSAAQEKTCAGRAGVN